MIYACNTNLCFRDLFNPSLLSPPPPREFRRKMRFEASPAVCIHGLSLRLWNICAFFIILFFPLEMLCVSPNLIVMVKQPFNMSMKHCKKCLSFWTPIFFVRQPFNMFRLPKIELWALMGSWCDSLYSVKKISGFANFIDEWSQCDFCFTNFGVILEYLESSFRLSSTWSWHVYTIVRDTRSSWGGPLTWKAQIHDGGHWVNFDRNLPSSCFVVQYNSLILMI